MANAGNQELFAEFIIRGDRLVIETFGISGRGPSLQETKPSESGIKKQQISFRIRKAK